jgi:hypothetical protein
MVIGQTDKDFVGGMKYDLVKEKETVDLELVESWRGRDLYKQALVRPSLAH